MGKNCDGKNIEMEVEIEIRDEGSVEANRPIYVAVEWAGFLNSGLTIDWKSLGDLPIQPKS